MAKKKEENEELIDQTADTRLEILQLIHKNRGTPEELADRLKLTKKEVNGHLKKLAGTELIRKVEDSKHERYETTLKGLSIIDPEEKKIWIIVSALIISVASVTAAWIHRKFGYLYNPERVAQSTSMSPWGIYMFIGWVTILVALLLFSARRRKRYLDYQEAMEEE